MAEKRNINLFTRRARVNNPDGSISTIRSMSFQDPRDKKETLIPTVINRGRGWEVVNDKQAINHYRKTGEHLGKFDTPEEATNFGEMLHTMEALKEKVPTFTQRLGYEQGKKQAEKQYSTWGEWAKDRFEKPSQPSHTFGVPIGTMDKETSDYFKDFPWVFGQWNANRGQIERNPYSTLTEEQKRGGETLEGVRARLDQKRYDNPFYQFPLTEEQKDIYQHYAPSKQTQGDTLASRMAVNDETFGKPNIVQEIELRRLLNEFNKTPYDRNKAISQGSRGETKYPFVRTNNTAYWKGENLQKNMDEFQRKASKYTAYEEPK